MTPFKQGLFEGLTAWLTILEQRPSERIDIERVNGKRVTVEQAWLKVGNSLRDAAKRRDKRD